MSAELEFPGADGVLLLLRPTAWAPAEGRGSCAVHVVRGVCRTVARTAPRVRRGRGLGDVDITQADFLLSIGRGIGDKENVELFEELAEKMGATLSVSRPLVDAGWMPARGRSASRARP